MGRKRNERADRGEQMNSRTEDRSSENRNIDSESLASNNGMEAGRAERIRGPGVESDRQAGDEGVDDSAMSRTHRDDMSGTPAHGDRLSGESGRQRSESQRSMRTQQRSNDERFDDASSFSGQGSQKEGSSEEAEGTGYTQESNTDRSTREDPLS